MTDGTFPHVSRYPGESRGSCALLALRSKLSFAARLKPCPPAVLLGVVSHFSQRRRDPGAPFGLGGADKIPHIAYRVPRLAKAARRGASGTLQTLVAQGLELPTVRWIKSSSYGPTLAEHAR